MRESTYLPPLIKALWRIGAKVPPPHFVGFASTVAVTGTFFALTWGVAMWFLIWRDDGAPPSFAFAASALAGVLHGVSMAAFYAHGRKKHRLPAWESL